MNKKNLLNKKEKAEITSDVKEAFKKAQENNEDALNYKQIKITTSGNTMTQEEIDNLFLDKNKKESSKRKIPVFVPIIIIIIIALLTLYWYLVNNPRTMFVKSIDSIFKTIENNLVESNYEKSEGKINIDYSINSSNNNYSELNKTKINISYKNDKKNKITSASIKPSYNDLNTIELTVYQENNKTYIYNQEVYDNYIQINNNYNYDIDSIKQILYSLNKAINNALTTQKYKNTEEEITINDKKIKANIISFELNNTNTPNILESINKSLKNDKKFIESYSNLTQITKDEAKTTINKKITKLKNYSSNMNAVTINLYTNSNYEFIKLEIIEKIDQNQDTITITQDNKNKYSYSFDITNNATTGTIEKTTKNNITTINLNTKTIENEKEISSINANIKIEESKIDKIEKIDISNAIKFEDLSSQDQANIYLKLFKDPNLTKVIQSLSTK